MQENIRLEVCPVTVSKEVNYCGDVILTYRITFPRFSGDACPGVAAALNRHYAASAARYEQSVMRRLLPQAICDRKESLRHGYPIHRYDAVREFEITYSTGCWLSLYTDTYEYTGGAHGTTVRTSETWDLSRCRILSLADICRRGRHPERALIEEIVRRIAQMPDSESAYFEDYANLVGRTFNSCSFYLSPGCLNIYFQQYDIAPYAAGIQVFCFNRKGGFTPQAACSPDCEL